MDTISYGGIALLAVFILPVLIINKIVQIKMNREIIISIIRMSVQLSIAGIYLQYIFDLNNRYLNMAYMLTMILIASFTVSRSAKLKNNKVRLGIHISMIIPNIIMILFLNKAVINLQNIFEARYIITITGMLLGNVLSGNIIGLNTYYQRLKDNGKIINYDLALGATPFQALKPYFKEAIEVSIKPTVASMATMGLVSLPGMMTGQILGGSVPKQAIMYQAAIMLAIFTTRYFNIAGALFISQFFIFDERDQIIL